MPLSMANCPSISATASLVFSACFSSSSSVMPLVSSAFSLLTRPIYSVRSLMAEIPVMLMVS